MKPMRHRDLKRTRRNDAMARVDDRDTYPPRWGSFPNALDGVILDAIAGVQLDNDLTEASWRYRFSANI